jgi:pimeloyl-ACP methyl ester carboxylesterase
MDSLYEHATELQVEHARLCVVTLEPLEPPVARHALLLHGNPSSLSAFSALVPALRRHAWVTAYDHPGFGRSGELEPGEPSLEWSARLGLSLLDRLGVRQAVDVIGHSHGAMVAVAMAAQAPERVRSIALLSSGGTPEHRTYQLLRTVPGLATLLPAVASLLYRPALLRPLARAVTALGARTSFAPEAPPAPFVARELEALRARPSTLAAMVRLTLDRPCEKVATLARKVEAPVLVLHGAADALVPIANAERLFELLRRRSSLARFVRLEGGHMTHLARPDRLTPVLEAWLDDLTVPSPRVEDASAPAADWTPPR